MYSSSVSNTSHTTHYPSIVKIEYPWHPLFGQNVQVHKRLEERAGIFYVIGLPDHTFHLLPDWMTDPAMRANSEIGPPRCSLDGLISLRQLLDAQPLSKRARSSKLKGKKGSPKGASIESTEGQSLPEKSSFPRANIGVAADSGRYTQGSDSTSDPNDPGLLPSEGGQPC
jgi:hypothetical protein